MSCGGQLVFFDENDLKYQKAMRGCEWHLIYEIALYQFTILQKLLILKWIQWNLSYCRTIINIFASFEVSHLRTWLIAMFDSRLSRTVSEVALPRSIRSFHETTPYWRTKSDVEGEMEEDGEKLASTSAGTSSSPYRTIEWRWGKESRMLRTLTRETRKNKNWLLKA